MSDLTLLSKVSNEAINDNLKTRFEHAEIYVRTPGVGFCDQWGRQTYVILPDLYRPCACICEPVQGL